MAEDASTGHCRTVRSDNASYALALDRAHNLSRLRDETGITSDRFKAGNDRNASPGELDFMHGGMTRRHEGFVSTMLTESGLSIPLRLRDFKALCDQKQDASRQARHFVCFPS